MDEADQAQAVEDAGSSTNTPHKVPRRSGETVRDIIVCYHCGKPRCIYSIKKLTLEQTSEIDNFKENVLYSCGGDIPIGYIFPEEGITCETHISVHYFSNRLKVKFPLVCHICGDNDLPDLSTVASSMDPDQAAPVGAT